MTLPDTLSTKVTLGNANVLVVNDTRNTGESDADFLTRHARHILAVMRDNGLNEIASLETYNTQSPTPPLAVTTWESGDTIETILARHVETLETA
jgi:hypothetical protein